MKLLFLNAYYTPEQTSSTHFETDLLQGIADRGHEMVMYTPTPTRCVSDEVRREYKKEKKHTTELDGALTVHRFTLYREGRNPLVRALRYAILELQHLWFGLHVKGVDLLPVTSTPPINGLIAAWLKKRKKLPYIYIVQDMFPESLVSTGMTTKGSLLWKIGTWVSNVTYRHAEHIVVISNSMKTTLIEKGVPAEKISVIYNWIDTEATHPISRDDNPLFDELGLSRDGFYVTYAGNLGNSQNVSLLVECAKRLADNTDIRFVIFGDGSEKAKLEAQIKDSGLTNIQLFPLQPMEKVSQVYSLGDASFVTCKKGVGIGAFPSKAASILATGTPIIASFDIDSDLCAILREHEAGLCADAENVDAAVEAVLTLYADAEQCRTYGENARALACDKFSKEKGVAARVAVMEKYAKH